MEASRHFVPMAFLTMIAGCGQSKSQSSAPEMAGGEPQGAFGMESVVALASDAGPGGLDVFCTGTLIANDAVLTAAHCKRAGGLRVYFGKNIRQGGTVRRATSLTPHPAFRHWVEAYEGRPQVRTENDLAIVRFEGGLPPGAEVAAMAETNRVAPGVRIVLWGYGLSDPRDLAQVRLGRVPESMGVRLSNEVSFTGKTFSQGLVVQFQSNDRKVFACSGDSGGPAFLEGAGGKVALVGVASYVNGSDARDIRCEEGVVHHTLVHGFRAWIAAQIR